MVLGSTGSGKAARRLIIYIHAFLCGKVRHNFVWQVNIHFMWFSASPDLRQQLGGGADGVDEDGVEDGQQPLQAKRPAPPQICSETNQQSERNQ